MKTKSRILASLLAVSMLFGLAACGGEKPAPSEDPATSTTEGTETPQPTESTAETTDIPMLKWITVGNGMPDNYAAWQSKVNEYLGEKIGVHVDVEVIPWGDFDTRRPTIVNTGSDYDIIFTNQNTYTNDVNIGAFADLSDIVETASPELKAMIPEMYWDACRVNDKIYAIPTYKDSSQSEFMVWDTAATDKVGVDPSTIKTLEEMTPALEAIKEDTGKHSFELYETTPAYLYFEYDNMSTGLPAIGVRHDDQDAKVVYTFEQPDLYGNLELFHDWFNKGIINSDAAVKPEEKNYRPVMVAQGWSSAVHSGWGPDLGIEKAVAYQWGPTVVSNDTVRGSLNCVSANSKHPEEALKLLETVNTDSYVRDLFYYGLEGENWEYVGEGDAKRVHRLNTNWSMAGYTQATFFTVTQEDIMEINQWDEVKELNEKAVPSVLLGFTLDTSEIKDQLINCNAIFERYKSELMTGTVDPAVSVPAMKEEMVAAGFDAIVEEAQKQVDAFMASK